MTKNEAYLYAKKIRRMHMTNILLESKMLAEGFSMDDIKLVKWWLNHKPAGI